MIPERKATVVIKEFYTKVMPVYINGKQTTKEEDFVAFAQPGSLNSAVTHAMVRHMLADAPQDDATDTVRANYELSQFIRTRYEAWKKGEELPDEGLTPLTAWAAINREALDLFKRNGIRSVEEVRDLTEASMSKLPIPHLRALKAQARQFLEMKDQNKSAAQMTLLQEQIADLQRQLQAQTEPEPVIKRGPGRPPSPKRAQEEAA